MKLWLSHHWRAMRSSIQQFARAPWPTLLTVLVIAVAMALPLLLWTVVNNLDQLGGSVRDGRQLSVFLNPSIEESAAIDVLVALEQREGISRVDLVSKDAALAELDDMAWVTDVIAALGDNPLPVTILVEPDESYANAGDVAKLADELTALPEVDQVMLDVVWLKRLEALVALVRRSTLVLAALLGLAVLLTVSNTVRLQVLNRSDEITIINRVGGTDGYIRRPFVYGGTLQGLIGGVLAIFLVLAIALYLRERVAVLVEAYGARFSLDGPGWTAVLLTLIVGAVLGWLASWLAVSRHLRSLQPR